MPKPKKPSNFKELQKLWYSKLKQKGFEDIERNEYHLKDPSSKFARTTGRSESSLTSIARDAKRDYYLMATDFLNTHTFETKLDENIWAYHTEGISCRDIAKLLNKVRKKKIFFTAVWTIINRLETIMKTSNGVI